MSFDLVLFGLTWTEISNAGGQDEAAPPILPRDSHGRRRLAARAPGRRAPVAARRCADPRNPVDAPGPGRE